MFVEKLNQRYFGGELSQTQLECLAPIEHESQEAQAFVERMGRQLEHQRIEARDFPDLLAWVVGFFIPKMLPGAWGGIVPPITQPGRHAVIDDYLARNPWRPLGDGERLLDLGCGFPPTTTLDTAERFPNVRITGADPSFGKYLVREPRGNYAVFDADAKLLYFQPGANEVDNWQALYDDPAATRRRFGELLAELRTQLPDDDGALASVSRDGTELVRNPVMEFERDHVRFEQAGFGADGLSGFQAVRCFNVLLYFDDAFRQAALEWLPRVVEDGGIFVSGCDWTDTRYARYSVHRHEGGKMKAKEFAFSIENVRPLEPMSIFALQDDEYDMNAMSGLIRILRGDEGFRADFDRRMDEILAELDFCARKPDGYLGAMPQDADPQAYRNASEAIGGALEKDGFHERAAAVLSRHGYRSWVNCVGHIAVEPT